LPKARFLGCDVISKTNTLYLKDEERKAIGYQTFLNTLDGAKVQEAWLLEVMNEKELSTLKMATEVTSFLDIHLVDFMASSQTLAPFHPSIYQFNPSSFKTSKRPTQIRIGR
jgi:hypothetical protein